MAIAIVDFIYLKEIKQIPPPIHTKSIECKSFTAIKLAIDALNLNRLLRSWMKFELSRSVAHPSICFVANPCQRVCCKVVEVSNRMPWLMSDAVTTSGGAAAKSLGNMYNKGTSGEIPVTALNALMREFI